MRRAALLLVLCAACGGGGGGAHSSPALGPASPPAPPPPPSGAASVGADAQRTGDPQAGYHALVNAGYIGCGFPYSVYSMFFGSPRASEQIPGRDGDNAQLPYDLTAFQAKSGVELVTPNCLTCHAGHINGQLVVGLGAADGDFTDSAGPYAQAVGSHITDPTEYAEWQKWNDRVQAIAPYTVTATIGQNPADNLAAVLFAHRDPKTLAWNDMPLLGLPPAQVIPVDVPPWWRMNKKNAMFYNAAGRGDHARIMMTASTLCTDTVADAQAIDQYFPDVEAFIESIQPPAYPFPIDRLEASYGRDVFVSHCSECHGTYGDGASYPNLLVPATAVGTDSLLAVGSAQFAQAYVGWFNASWYGEVAHLDPQPAYVAPPLDGIWATAPYLHNGSVPTIAALLDSPTRPTYWTRTFDSTDYDQVGLGWNFTVMDHGQAAEPLILVKKAIYDTTELGASNGGHLYGDALTAGERAAVLEYLKTL